MEGLHRQGGAAQHLEATGEALLAVQVVELALGRITQHLVNVRQAREFDGGMRSCLVRGVSVWMPNESQPVVSCLELFVRAGARHVEEAVPVALIIFLLLIETDSAVLSEKTNQNRPSDDVTQHPA